MIVTHTSSKGDYMSTTGNTYFSESGRYNAELMYSAHEGEKATSFFGSDVTVTDLESPFIECAFIARELTDIENQIHSKPTEGKFTGTVIFTPGCLVGTVFGNICENFASDSVLLDGTSLWKDKLGEKVADERISISFNPSDERIVNGQLFTGEGFIAEDFDFIKDGRLESFLLSQYVANKTGNERAKNSSLSMIVKSGETPLEEMIKNVKKGVIIGRFSGGSPGTNGEFSGVAKNGFFIEDGRIVSALSVTMISGNLAEMLNNLVDISAETLVDGSVVAPYMAFDGITVSGK
jgi:PmbA protein